ncbi:hypothetical protein G7054_g3692 [Neopestalotiopsis clavispora]|nr:hypothetical protein G7054_g3692 [Neopestalotiopsis clavispora]
MESSYRKHGGENLAFAGIPPPAKRLCLPSLEEGAKVTCDVEALVAVATEGLIGQRTEDIWEQAPAISVVETSTSPNDQELVCCGALFNVQAAIDLPKGITHCRDLVEGQEPTQQYQIRSTTATTTRNPLSMETSRLLIPKRQLTSVPCKTYRASSSWACICGQYKDGGNSGDVLGKLGAFLQHPSVVKNGIEYYNPQLYYPHGKQEPLTHLVGLTDADISANLLSEEVETVLASLDDCDIDSIDSDIDLMDVLTELRR